MTMSGAAALLGLLSLPLHAVSFEAPRPVDGPALPDLPAAAVPGLSPLDAALAPAPALAAPGLAPLSLPPAAAALPAAAASPAAAAASAASHAAVPAAASPARTLHAMHDALSHDRGPARVAAKLDSAYDGRPAGAAPQEPAVQEDGALTPQGRLPGAVVPERYDARVSLSPEEGTFTGSVRIEVSASRPVTAVVLHALDLSVSGAKVDGRELPAASIRVDAKAETATLLLPEALPAGKAVLELAYSGRMNSQMRGLYQSKGVHRGKEEKYAFTHFEPTNARRMVPSFDEPALKAVFKLTLEAPAGLTLLSNMPPAQRRLEGGRQVVVFQDSPRMSTYLLAVAAARLVPTRKRVQGVDVAVWTAPQDKGQAAFALETAEQSLLRLNRYFRLPYQLPKLDLVSVPDFASGAMENWGAIFFRDSAVLVDPKLSSTRARRRVGVVVAHELVHQWFGNLVTMKWWNDLWLNEAFATWLSYKIVDRWLPEWKLWLEFEQGKKSPLAIDSLRSTRAISANVSSSADIQAMFDPLTYDKGGSILRMLEGYLGEKAFRAGIRLYMRRHRYGNTEAADLWRALEEASGQPVTSVASAWLEKPGYPLVSASAAGPRALALSQRRFFSDSAKGDGTVWPVPVVIRYKLSGEKKARERRVLFSNESETVSLPGRGKLEWAYPNAGETGFYRVSLDQRLLGRLLAAGPRVLAPAERLGLLAHLWAQAKSGERPIGDFLTALAAFKGETERSVLEDVGGYLKALGDQLASPQDRPALAAFARDLLGARWKRLGWKPKSGEGDEARLSRAALLSALSAVAPDDALRAGVDAALSRALSGRAKLDPALLSPLLTAGARLGGPGREARYEAALKSASTPERRDQLLRALGEFSDRQDLDRALALTLKDAVRGQDAWKPLVFALANPAGQAQAWEFVKANWPALKDKLGPRGAAQVIGALSSLQGAAARADVAAFFADPANAVPSAQKKLEQSLDAIDVSLRFRTAQGARLSAWLSGRGR